MTSFIAMFSNYRPIKLNKHIHQSWSLDCHMSRRHFSTSKTLQTQTAVSFVCDGILNHLTPQNVCSQVPFCFVSAVWYYCNHKLTTKHKLQNFWDVLLCMGHLVGGSLFCYASNLSKTGKIKALHKDVWHTKRKIPKIFSISSDSSFIASSVTSGLNVPLCFFLIE